MNRRTEGGMSIVGNLHNKGGGIQLALAFLMLVFSTLFGSHAIAAAPPAGSVIGNQATASYKDSNGTDRATTSNLVETTVLQVRGVAIQADRTQNASPGQTAYLAHVVTNTGNDTDTYNLSTVNLAGTFNFNGLVIYADLNQDGVPDGGPITQTPAIPAGGTFGIVVGAQVPGTATSGQQDQFDIVATGIPGTVAAPTAKNTDTVIISNNAVIVLNKSTSVQSAKPGDTVKITLRYTNNGSKAAAVTLTDVLDDRYVYQAGTGVWAGQSMTDAVGGDAAGIDYSYDSTSKTVKAVVASVAPGQTGIVTFDVKVAPGATGDIPNTAEAQYDANDDGDPGNDPPTPSNPTIVNVADDYMPRISDTNSTTDDDGVEDNFVTENFAPQGGSVIFDNVVRNMGSAVDTIDVIVETAGSTFPAGTSFQLLRADGTPMTDSNGNGIPDTGPLQPWNAATPTANEYHVHLRATLPTGASGNNGGNGYTVVKTARSAADPTKTDTVTDKLLTINGNTVNLTNDAAAGQPGVKDAGPSDAPANTNPVSPGQSTSFALFVNNTSAQSDSFELAAGTTGSPFGGALPAGWSVVFHRGEATGAVITNTGVIAAGGNMKVTAVVSVPAGQAPTTQSIFFQAKSPTTNAFDVKHDAVQVTANTDVSVTPNNALQGYPGAAVVYSHTLSNNGNTDVTSGTLDLTNTTWANSAVLYYDKNNNGIIDAGDPVVDNIDDIVAADGGDALKPGETKPLLVRVFVPSGAADGASNTTSVTVTAPGDGDPTNNKADDTTTVVLGDVMLVKTQALDAACDGTADGAFVQTQLQANPGECLIYQITMTNQGAAAINNAKISDATPTYTTYVSGSATPGSISQQPAAGSAGTVIADVGTLAQNASATLTFAVKIQQ